MSANPAPSGVSADTIVAIIAGAAVSISVAVLAALSQWRDRKQRTDLAREDRAQERLKSAYEELLPTLHGYRSQVALVEPPVRFSPTPELPKLPETEEIIRQFARAQLFGSPKVRLLLDKVRTDITALQLAIGDVERVKQWAASIAAVAVAHQQLREAYERLDAAKAVVFEDLADVEAEMRTDLGLPPCGKP